MIRSAKLVDNQCQYAVSSFTKPSEPLKYNRVHLNDVYYPCCIQVNKPILCHTYDKTKPNTTFIYYVSFYGSSSACEMWREHKKSNIKARRMFVSMCNGRCFIFYLIFPSWFFASLLHCCVHNMKWCDAHNHVA